MNELKVFARELEGTMTQFYILGLFDIAEQYFIAINLIYGTLTEKEYFQEYE